MLPRTRLEVARFRAKRRATLARLKRVNHAAEVVVDHYGVTSDMRTLDEPTHRASPR